MAMEDDVIKTPVRRRESIELELNGPIIAINSEVVVGCEMDRSNRLKLAVFAEERIPIYMAKKDPRKKQGNDPDKIGSRRFRLTETSGNNTVNADPYVFELKRKTDTVLYLDIYCDTPIVTERFPHQDERVVLWRLRNEAQVKVGQNF